MTDTKEQITGLKNRLKDLNDKLSKLRKKGVNTRMVDFRLPLASPKIMVASATQQQKDIDQASKFLESLESEVASIQEPQKE